MFYRARLQAAAALASLSLLAGCGLLPGDASDVDQKLVVGTTSEPSTLDPAAAWDGSWELMRNVFQTLVSFPTGSTKPQPDAAEECRFTDHTSTAYRCRLRKGLKFSNGDKLDADAVKYSIDRISQIGVKGGPVGMLGSLDRVETKGDDVVIFNLKKPDATFPFVLATPAMSLVAPSAYSKNKLRADGKVTGSGPYLLDAYQQGNRSELVRNPDYKGFADRKNDAVTIRYFKESGAMVEALKKNEIDATYRGLSAADVVDIEDKSGKDDLQIVESVGADIRFLVFNPDDPAAGKPAVRRAIAQLVDRDALVAKVYRGTAEPLYSMVPKGIAGHTTVFFDTFGDPSKEKARRILAEADITTPVAMTFWYTTDRYGSSTAPEFDELKRQLEASGLFRITLKSRPWKTFQDGFNQGSSRFSAAAGSRTSRTRTTSSPRSSARTASRAPRTSRTRSPGSCCRRPASRATGAPSARSSSGPRRSWRRTCGCCRCGRASCTWPPARTSAAASAPSTRRPSCRCGSCTARPAGRSGRAGGFPLAHRVVSGAR